MAAFLDTCRFVANAGGTGDFVYSSTVTGYQSPTLANAVNGRVYKYRAESSNLLQWEIGEGAYNSGTGTFARTSVLYNSSGTTSKINFTVAPQVAIVALKKDLISIEEANAFTASQRAQARTNISAVLAGHLYGLGLSTPGSSANFTVAAGEAADSTAADLMVLGSAITKNYGANWTVGNTGGALDTGSTAANTWYYVYLIKRPDTGVVDALVSLSATAPTLPTNYTLFRRIGAMKTNGSSQWTPFQQFGDDFYWVTPVLDVNGGGFTASDTTAGFASLPANILVKGFFNLTAFTGTAASQLSLLVRPNFQTSAAPAFGASPGITFYDNTTNGQGVTGNFDMILDSSNLLVLRPSVASTTIRIAVRGWADTRRRLG